jgi:acetaldehyde dehydrogenase/alcohol dehydrogenase
MRTVGVIARDDIEDMIEVAEPVGALCAITPVTNPTSTTVSRP